MFTAALIESALLVAGVAGHDSYDAEASIPRAHLPVQNQRRCGSCWSFSATEQLSARILKTTDAHSLEGHGSLVSPQVPLSFPQYSRGHGCDGGWPYNVGLMAKKHDGLPDVHCAPYVSGNCQRDPAGNGCTHETWGHCWGSKTWRHWGAHRGAFVGVVRQLSGEHAYKADIRQHGDLSVSFDFYREFNAYRGGVMTHATPDSGGHAVLITGWGSQNGIAYWKIRNSWGSNWGEHGYCRMIRGRNFQNIEKTGASFALSGTLSENENDTFVPPAGVAMPGGWVERSIADEPVAAAIAAYHTWALGREVAYPSIRGESSNDSSVELVRATSQVVEGMHVSLHVRADRRHFKVLAHRPPMYSDANEEPTFGIISVDDVFSDFVVV